MRDGETVGLFLLAREEGMGFAEAAEFVGVAPPRTAERWAAGLLPHSDRGGHYRWPGWVALCRGNRLVRSMSRKGRSCDNARMEGFFGTLKSEFFHSRDWEGVDRDGSMVELHRWLKWFRSGRVSESLGWRMPDGNRRLLGYAV